MRSAQRVFARRFQQDHFMFYSFAVQIQFDLKSRVFSFRPVFSESSNAIIVTMWPLGRWYSIKKIIAFTDHVGNRVLQTTDYPFACSG